MKRLTKIEKDWYLISRTSAYGAKPIDGAERVLLNKYTEDVNMDNLDDLYYGAWIIHITDIWKFVKEHGRCIIHFSRDNSTFEIPRVEIYDDWRE